MTTIPDDMIERVARAIATVEGIALPNDMTLSYPGIGKAIRKARAAIEAMQPAHDERTQRRKFNRWFSETMADADGRYSHMPKWLKADLWLAWQAGSTAIRSQP